MTFKQGDTVERIKDNHFGMKVGDRATVKECNGGSVYLEEYEGGHTSSKLKLVSRWLEDGKPNWKKRYTR